MAKHDGGSNGEQEEAPPSAPIDARIEEQAPTALVRAAVVPSEP